VTLAGGALVVALVSFADTGALSTATALKSGRRVDPNSEVKALGAANLLSGLFQGFPTSASSSRTAVAMSVGSRTQLAGVLAALGVIAMLVWAPELLADLPSATLAAIVISASFVIFDLKTTIWLWRVRRSEFLLSLGGFLGVVLVGILEGIVIAVVLSLANFIRQAWIPHSTELARVKGVKGYHDRERHPDGETIPGLLMIRFDAPLFFANAPRFGRRLQRFIRIADRPIHRVLLVAEAMTDIDTTGAEILTDLLDDMERKNLTLAFAGLKGGAKDRLRDYGLYERIGEPNFYPTVGAAVKDHNRTA
jgi:MFS superfamily sulfate permease-like transporter